LVYVLHPSVGFVLQFLQDLNIKNENSQGASSA